MTMVCSTRTKHSNFGHHRFRVLQQVFQRYSLPLFHRIYILQIASTHPPLRALPFIMSLEWQGSDGWNAAEIAYEDAILSGTPLPPVDLSMFKEPTPVESPLRRDYNVPTSLRPNDVTNYPDLHPSVTLEGEVEYLFCWRKLLAQYDNRKLIDVPIVRLHYLIDERIKLDVEYAEGRFVFSGSENSRYGYLVHIDHANDSDEGEMGAEELLKKLLREHPGCYIGAKLPLSVPHIYTTAGWTGYMEALKMLIPSTRPFPTTDEIGRYIFLTAPGLCYVFLICGRA
ncbi:hypothetical protein EV421DRAFT_1818023 [Armillaria borealis]|uniref:Uncharacterized protein n=1 Tax=Armillaria borealis TaxID=47425 RepID=A0AA39JE95_9AGAR|nr:hypothetical protein EV421DRAFT_1818023 [Armillaria borealis]